VDAVFERPLVGALADLADPLALFGEVDEFEVRRERASDDVFFLRGQVGESLSDD
jgi:hypothetical protein